MRKILFIINPVAGKGKNEIIKNQIEGIFFDVENQIIISKTKNEITNIAKKFFYKGYTDFIAVGGDGTLSEMINGIGEKSVRFGVIPVGTGNDFARNINMPDSILESLNIIKNNKTVKVDIGRINSEKFINVICCGIDGQIIKDKEKLKKIVPGPSSYLLSTLKALLFYRPTKMILKIDDKILEEEILLIAVGNGKYIGGGMNILPNAKIDDGYFDVCIVGKVNRIRLFTVFPKIFKGTHIKEKEIKYFKCKNIKIESKEKTYINSDGNLISYLPANIAIEHNKYEVIIP